ncbi:MAG: DUF501 domain-containing protein [Bacillota bacterium]
MCSLEELELITQQLGRKPRNVAGIAKYCAEGYPQVVVTYPIFEQQGELKLFPTTYWLSCPKLVAEISVLEAEGLIQELQQEIMSDSVLEAALSTAHQQYAKRRVNLLNEKDKSRLKNQCPKRWQIIAESGVGGIVAKEGIKCLHTHYADYLVNPQNPVGQRVDKLLTADLAAEYQHKCQICHKE